MKCRSQKAPLKSFNVCEEQRALLGCLASLHCALDFDWLFDSRTVSLLGGLTLSRRAEQFHVFLPGFTHGLWMLLQMPTWKVWNDNMHTHTDIWCVCTTEWNIFFLGIIDQAPFDTLVQQIDAHTFCLHYRLDDSTLLTLQPALKGIKKKWLTPWWDIGCVAPSCKSTTYPLVCSSSVVCSKDQCDADPVGARSA